MLVRHVISPPLPSVARGARVGFRILQVEAATLRNEDDGQIQEFFEAVCQVRDVVGSRYYLRIYREA